MYSKLRIYIDKCIIYVSVLHIREIRTSYINMKNTAATEKTRKVYKKKLCHKTEQENHLKIDKINMF